MLYRFDKNFEDLPRRLPLFPLSKVLLLPRAKLGSIYLKSLFICLIMHLPVDPLE